MTMTDGKKATAVLDYLEGLDGKTVINILNPMLDDEALALIYDGLVEDGTIESGGGPLDGYSEEYRSGIDYALEHLDDADRAVIRAECNKAYMQHLVPDENVVDDHKITDLLEEYGEDNGLPEGWYLDEYDASEILLMV